jgi:hypothetical protein
MTLTCQLYKLALPDQTRVTLHLRVSVSKYSVGIFSRPPPVEGGGVGAQYKKLSTETRNHSLLWS